MARTDTATTAAPAVGRRTARRLGAAAAVLALGAGSALGSAGTAAAAPVHHGSPVNATSTATATSPAAAMEAQFLALLNKHRVANHDQPVTVSADLVSVATAWSGRMAGPVGLEHNPKLPDQVKNWQVLGENVGVGSDVTTLDNAFWASAGHRSNELYTTFSQVGIGVVVSGGQVWVTFDFRQPLRNQSK